MKLIAHRGNINGPNPIDENKPSYIMLALEKGYDCEIDVRLIDNKLYLGHDSPQYHIEIDFLLNNSSKLWIHCKNIEALDYLLKYNDLNLFWHQNDEYTITSKGFIWCYHGKTTTNKSILLMPEWNEFIITECFGICTDYVLKFT